MGWQHKVWRLVSTFSLCVFARADARSDTWIARAVQLEDRLLVVLADGQLARMATPPGAFISDRAGATVGIARGKVIVRLGTPQGQVATVLGARVLVIAARRLG